jgi:hypothetical protein
VKVISSLASPEDELEPLKYNMPSRPVIFCSMIWVTVFSTVSADAPG